MTLTLELQHQVQACDQPTERAIQVAVMFGLRLGDQSQHTIIPPIRLPLVPGSVVFITGVSGGGKSTLLRLIAQAIDALPAQTPDGPKPALIRSDELARLSEQPLVDALGLPEVDAQADAPLSPPAELDTVCQWLSRAGLNDAAVMVRRPGVLSEGQRHRLGLAQALAVAERRPEPWAVLLADEFGSTLDRTTAHAVARSTCRWVAQSRVCLVAATAHDDLLEPLAPDVLVEVAPGGVCQVHLRSA